VANGKQIPAPSIIVQDPQRSSCRTSLQCHSEKRALGLGVAARKKRDVVLNGRKTSVSLEEAFWEGVREIANTKGWSINRLVSQIACRVSHSDNLSAEIRCYVLGFYRSLERGSRGSQDDF